MVNFTIAVLQLASPFILICLLIGWVYSVSKKADDCLKKIADLQKGEELLHTRISNVDGGLYNKIRSVEEAVEELDDVVMGVIEGYERREANGKLPS